MLEYFSLQEKPTIISRRNILIAVVALLVSGCQFFDSHREIYGKWRAESVSIGGFSLVIGPALEFARGKASIFDKSVAVEGYEKIGNVITVHISGGASLSFEIIDKNTIAFDMPLNAKIIYKRVL